MARVRVKSWIWMHRRKHHFECVGGTTGRPRFGNVLKLILDHALTSCFLCLRQGEENISLTGSKRD